MRKLSGLFASVALLFTGCSMVYSPFAHLPTAPLKHDAAEVEVAAGALPYATPTFFVATGGYELTGRYALTDHFTLQGRAIATGGDLQGGYIHGLSLDAIIMLDDSHLDKLAEAHGAAEFREALLPRLMVMTGYNAIRGWGASLAYALWTPKVLGFSPYLAIGPAVGAGSTNGGWFGAAGTATGFGGVANLGLALPISDKLHLHGESALSVLHNTDDHRTHWNVVPELSMSYRF